MIIVSEGKDQLDNVALTVLEYEMGIQCM